MNQIELIAKNALGKTINHVLPYITTGIMTDKNLSQLAVIFQINVDNLKETKFLPNFSKKNHQVILQCQKDFLWEKSCYELFIAFDKDKNTPYIEINVSPTGEFNLYHFDGYRIPKQMPPRRLKIDDKKRQQLINFYYTSSGTPAIFWQSSLLNQRAMQDKVEKIFPLEINNHRLVMMIDLAILADMLNVKMGDEIWLNPCAVFEGEQELTYFAHQHASPPDFHDKRCWIKS